MEPIRWQHVVIPVVAHFALATFMLMTAEAMSKNKRFKLHPQFVRKYMHIFASLQPLGLFLCGTRRSVMIGLMISALVINSYLYFMTRMESLDDGGTDMQARNDTTMPHNAKVKSKSPGTPGVVYFPITLIASFWVMDNMIYTRNTFIGVSMVLTLSLADGFAALAGTACARFSPSYRAPVGNGNKTVVGSATCFCVTLLAVSLASFLTKQQTSWVQLAFVALASTLAEGFFSLGLDNLTQPLAVFLTLHGS